LRSLLAVASKEEGDAQQRFKNSVNRLKEILQKHSRGKLNSPIILEIISFLEDESRMQNEYFTAFKASLIIVDLVLAVFISEKIRSSVLSDDFVSWESEEKDEEGFEKAFIYTLPEGFNDEAIKSPVAFLLDRMIAQLDPDHSNGDLERVTTMEFLAINSN
jgi:hypothetical protein